MEESQKIVVELDVTRSLVGCFVFGIALLSVAVFAIVVAFRFFNGWSNDVRECGLRGEILSEESDW